MGKNNFKKRRLEDLSLIELKKRLNEIMLYEKNESRKILISQSVCMGFVTILGYTICKMHNMTNINTFILFLLIIGAVILAPSIIYGFITRYKIKKIISLIEEKAKNN